MLLYRDKACVLLTEDEHIGMFLLYVTQWISELQEFCMTSASLLITIEFCILMVMVLASPVPVR